MKHATLATLQLLQPLLDELRELGPLVERTPGAFYVKSKAFLHFHEDPSGLYADVKLDLASFTRVRVSTAAERSKLLLQVRGVLTSR
jgi:hypothetical protein